MSNKCYSFFILHLGAVGGQNFIRALEFAYDLYIWIYNIFYDIHEFQLVLLLLKTHCLDDFLKLEFQSEGNKILKLWSYDCSSFPIPWGECGEGGWGLSGGTGLFFSEYRIRSKLREIETFCYFTKFSFPHKWNKAWFLVINMVYTSCLTSCRAT